MRLAAQDNKLADKFHHNEEDVIDGKCKQSGRQRKKLRLDSERNLLVAGIVCFRSHSTIQTKKNHPQPAEQPPAITYQTVLAYYAVILLIDYHPSCPKKPSPWQTQI